MDNNSKKNLPQSMPKVIVDDLDALIGTLPLKIQDPLKAREDLSELLEVVLDLGRRPEARFPGTDVYLNSNEILEEDIQHVIERIGMFGDDNRAGIERTLHRFSAIRNRSGKPIGITCRVGRALFGAINPIEELASTGKNILLLGRPGVGKTTMLREITRALADESHKRVVVVDTSNEIAGDGDIPHPGIGRARRMQVPTPTLQHDVMIEAVENHTPEVIIIDEMGTTLEVQAARTIAERGVQLIATAHGNTLNNVLMNPTLSDLVGGIQTVILGDEEAMRRRTQKTILERQRPPTFDIVVEIQSWESVDVHADVASVVDHMLRGDISKSQAFRPRTYEHRSQRRQTSIEGPMTTNEPIAQAKLPSPELVKLYPYGVNRRILEEANIMARSKLKLTDNLTDADMLLTTKTHYRRGSLVLKQANLRGKPIHVLRKNTRVHVDQFLNRINSINTRHSSIEVAMQEAQEAIESVCDGEQSVNLSPQRPYVRRLQHQLASSYNLQSQSIGQEPFRSITVFREGQEK
jgi:stage III sporulation protein SpoIIIAA